MLISYLLSGPVDVDTGVAESPGCLSHSLLPVGLVPGTPAWVLGLPTFSGRVMLGSCAVY